MRYDIPEYLLSDRSKKFENVLFQELSKFEA